MAKSVNGAMNNSSWRMIVRRPSVAGLHSSMSTNTYSSTTIMSAAVITIQSSSSISVNGLMKKRSFRHCKPMTNIITATRRESSFLSLR